MILIIHEFEQLATSCKWLGHEWVVRLLPTLSNKAILAQPDRWHGLLKAFLGRLGCMSGQHRQESGVCHWKTANVSQCA